MVFDSESLYFMRMAGMCIEVLSFGDFENLWGKSMNNFTPQILHTVATTALTVGAAL